MKTGSDVEVCSRREAGGWCDLFFILHALVRSISEHKSIKSHICESEKLQMTYDPFCFTLNHSFPLVLNTSYSFVLFAPDAGSLIHHSLLS